MRDLNIYFVQNESSIVDSKELIQKIDNYLATKGIIINGYQEFNGFLPIDPTTLKPKTKVVDGFIKYINDDWYDVYYDQVNLDIYREHIEKNYKRKIVK